MTRLYPTSTERQLLAKRIEELVTGSVRDRALIETYGSAAELPGERLAIAVAQSRQNNLYRQAVQENEPSDAMPHLTALVEQLPPTSSGRAYRPHATRIGIIADLFLYKSFEGLADFVAITPENYEEHRESLELLLVVSTWRGLDNASWVGLGGNSDVRATLLERIIPLYRAAGIPVVYYSKEDPPNYRRFAPLAAHCDFVFTSAVEMIPRYQRDCPGAAGYDVLPFGVNPRFHSPIGSRTAPSNAAFFAGSWFTGKYAGRAKWGTRILDGLAAANGYSLTIFNRNSAIENGKYDFPLRYSPYINDAVGHDFLLDLQRVSDVAVNLNSVMASQSMYANRAVELQAAGTLVVSSYNQGLNSRFPQIHIANSVRDVRDMLDTLSFEELREVQAAGIRSVFDTELSLYRLDKILETAGLAAPRPGLTVDVVAPTPDDALREEFAAQTVGEVRVQDRAQYDEQRSEADIVLEVDPAFSYGAEYVKDLVNAFKYADADVVQKLPGTLAEEDAASHRFADRVRETAGTARWRGPAGRALLEDGTVYSTDAFGFAPRGRPTVRVRTIPARPAQLSVVVPVYNNGGHLRHKCFASLRRSSMFDAMEIILVDDGSTEAATVATLQELADSFSNVKVHRFPPGGSGSASRPRNKGLELATAPFVTYLDPDNEAVEDGYAILWDSLQDNDADFAIGNMSIWRESHRIANYSNYLRKYLREEDGFHFPDRSSLPALDFRTMSIQAAVARTAWLRPLGLEQPVGAVGQDSFFFQQMLYYARKIKVFNRTIHTYYSAVANSTVNSVSVGFFEKYLPLEEARSRWLFDIGLDAEYRATRLEPFFRDWFLSKLRLVKDEHRDEAMAVVARLGRMYGDHEWSDPDVLEFWAAVETETERREG
ncbi:glycosyltransferase [Zafaria sp. Z1313]|uniref:glycosyltransferase n=1 Tax=Zafaria sp. Z1313 TaxID=3423202 RepID=UPI003D303C47